MGYTVYTSAGTGGFAVEAVLEVAGAEWQRVVVDTKAGAHRTPEFLKLNPMAQVPTLMLPDGTVMTESAAMCVLIAERHPDAGLSPPLDSPLRAQFLRWMMFMSSVIYDRYTTDATGAPAVRAAAVAEMDHGLAILDRALGSGTTLIGDGYTAADPYLFMLVHWHPDVAGVLSRCPAIARHAGAVRARPEIVALNEFHRLW